MIEHFFTSKDKMSADSGNDDSLYPIAVLIDELRNEDVQVKSVFNFYVNEKMVLTMSCCM